jgi:hypothetical protein
MNTTTSQTVLVADSTNVAGDDAPVSVFEQGMSLLTGNGVSSIFQALPGLELHFLTELVARLESTMEVNGVVYTVSEARSSFKALHVAGIREGKRTCSQLPTWAKKSDGPDVEYAETVIDEEIYDIFTVNRGFIDVKSNDEGVRDYVGVPCLLREADSRLYNAIDEFIGELGMGKSRRGNKGYWSDIDVEQYVIDAKARIAEIS